MDAADLAEFERWFEREPELLGERAIDVQVQLLERAAYTGREAFIVRLLALGPALLQRRPPPPSRALAFALEYGNAALVPLLTRIWPLPDDLPHAAGVGDANRVRRWFDDAGEPALGSPDDHYPGGYPQVRVDLHWGANRVEHVLDVALAWACINHHFDIATFLLEHGADIDTRWGSHEPASILHECAMTGNYEATRFLIDHGIDMTLLDHRWQSTAEGWARHGAGDEAMATFLAEAEARRKEAP